MGPRQTLVLQVRAVHSREQPGADDVLTCGRRSIGKVEANRALEASSGSAQWVTICGVSEEVAQVSMMSFSAVKPPGTSRWDSS